MSCYNRFAPRIFEFCVIAVVGKNISGFIKQYPLRNIAIFVAENHPRNLFSSRKPALKMCG